MEEIKKLYAMRRGIETSFRELKYAIGLSCFHSKKAAYIMQETAKDKGACGKQQENRQTVRESVPTVKQGSAVSVKPSSDVTRQTVQKQTKQVQTVQTVNRKSVRNTKSGGRQTKNRKGGKR